MSTLPTFTGSTTQIQCFRTRLCHFHLQQRCTRGQSCLFAHSDTEVRRPPDLSKTKLCVKWRRGVCRHGADCSYAHGAHELRPSTANSAMPSVTQPLAMVAAQQQQSRRSAAASGSLPLAADSTVSPPSNVVSSNTDDFTGPVHLNNNNARCAPRKPVRGSTACHAGKGAGAVPPVLQQSEADGRGSRSSALSETNLPAVEGLTSTSTSARRSRGRRGNDNAVHAAKNPHGEIACVIDQQSVQSPSNSLCAFPTTAQRPEAIGTTCRMSSQSPLPVPATSGTLPTSQGNKVSASFAAVAAAAFGQPEEGSQHQSAPRGEYQQTENTTQPPHTVSQPVDMISADCQSPPLADVNPRRVNRTTLMSPARTAAADSSNFAATVSGVQILRVPTTRARLPPPTTTPSTSVDRDQQQHEAIRQRGDVLSLTSSNVVHPHRHHGSNDKDDLDHLAGGRRQRGSAPSRSRVGTFHSSERRELRVSMEPQFCHEVGQEAADQSQGGGERGEETGGCKRTPEDQNGGAVGIADDQNETREARVDRVMRPLLAKLYTKFTHPAVPPNLSSPNSQDSHGLQGNDQSNDDSRYHHHDKKDGVRGYASPPGGSFEVERSDHECFVSSRGRAASGCASGATTACGSFSINSTEFSFGDDDDDDDHDQVIGDDVSPDCDHFPAKQLQRAEGMAAPPQAGAKGGTPAHEERHQECEEGKVEVGDDGTRLQYEHSTDGGALPPRGQLSPVAECSSSPQAEGPPNCKALRTLASFDSHTTTECYSYSKARHQLLRGHSNGGPMASPPTSHAAVLTPTTLGGFSPAPPSSLSFLSPSTPSTLTFPVVAAAAAPPTTLQKVPHTIASASFGSFCAEQAHVWKVPALKGSASTGAAAGFAPSECLAAGDHLTFATAASPPGASSAVPTSVHQQPPASFVSSKRLDIQANGGLAVVANPQYNAHHQPPSAISHPGAAPVAMLPPPDDGLTALPSAPDGFRFCSPSPPPVKATNPRLPYCSSTPAGCWPAVACCIPRGMPPVTEALGLGFSYLDRIRILNCSVEDLKRAMPLMYEE